MEKTHGLISVKKLNGGDAVKAKGFTFIVQSFDLWVLTRTYARPSSGMTIKKQPLTLFILRVGYEKTKELFASEDITPQQFNILRILRGSHPQPLSTLQIRERMLDKMSDTSRIVDRLMSKGLVKKGLCKKDRRLVDITISDKGRKLLEKIDARQDELDGILGNLSKKEAVYLSDLLDKIRADS